MKKSPRLLKALGSHSLGLPEGLPSGDRVYRNQAVFRASLSLLQELIDREKLWACLHTSLPSHLQREGEGARKMYVRGDLETHFSL